MELLTVVMKNFIQNVKNKNSIIDLPVIKGNSKITEVIGIKLRQ